MPSFGFNCDEKTYRLIQSIPPGKRSQVIRDAINAYVPEIDCMVKEYWKIRREEAQRELEREKRREEERERYNKYLEQIRKEENERRKRQQREREIVAKAEADHWSKLYKIRNNSLEC